MGFGGKRLATPEATGIRNGALSRAWELSLCEALALDDPPPKAIWNAACATTLLVSSTPIRKEELRFLRAVEEVEMVPPFEINLAYYKLTKKRKQEKRDAAWQRLPKEIEREDEFSSRALALWEKYGYMPLTTNRAAGRPREGAMYKADQLLELQDKLDADGTDALPYRPVSFLPTSLRELTEYDLERWSQHGPGAWPKLDNLSARHHRIAQLLAQGHSVLVVANMTGTVPSALSQMMASPAFTALIADYAHEIFDADRAFGDYLKTVTIESVSALRTAIQSGLVPAKDLAGIAFGLLDRTGHGSTQRVEVAVKRRLDAEEIASIKARAVAEARGVPQIERKIIDVTPEKP